jgi:hypothetical protein
LDQPGVLGVAQRGETEERVHGGQTGITGGHAVCSHLLQMLEERPDQRGVEVSEVEGNWCLSRPLLGERQQQPERVTVRGDGMSAGPSLSEQPLE